MNLDLSGKRAVVCGSTQGIGKASAIELAKLGASITLLARDEAKLKTVLTELDTSSGQQHDYLIADFNHPNDLKITVDIYAQRNPVHILYQLPGFAIRHFHGFCSSGNRSMLSFLHACNKRQHRASSSRINVVNAILGLISSTCNPGSVL